MIAVTGAAGFIGSVIVGYLNKQGIDDIVIYDDLLKEDQFRNLVGKKFYKIKSSKEIIPKDVKNFDTVIHFGANSSTLEKDWSSIYETNVVSTRTWHDLCQVYGKKFIFASTAAIYGNGSGPLNLYAFSKSVSEREITNGVILRLFNVYGPNEYHKGRMASTIFHWYCQIQETGMIKIFRNSDQYRRDFVWVEDVAKTVLHMIVNYKEGVYDLGSGTSVSFEDLADCLIKAIGGEKEYISIPADLKNQYQSNTLADIADLKNTGMNINSFATINEGIQRYSKFLESASRY